jgi:4-alpha-glucanotransferase
MCRVADLLHGAGLRSQAHEELSDTQEQHVWSYLGRSGGAASEVAPALMHLAWESAAALAIAPLQDLLNLGTEARMNVPGRADGNWRWRCTDDMLSASVFESLRDLTQASARYAGLETPRTDASMPAAS